MFTIKREGRKMHTYDIQEKALLKLIKDFQFFLLKMKKGKQIIIHKNKIIF